MIKGGIILGSASVMLERVLESFFVVGVPQSLGHVHRGTGREKTIESRILGLGIKSGDLKKQ